MLMNDGCNGNTIRIVNILQLTLRRTTDVKVRSATLTVKRDEVHLACLQPAKSCLS